MTFSIKWLVTLIVLTTTSITLATMDTYCPTDEGWIDADDLGCFFFGDVFMDWFEAQDYCYKKGNGSVLAEIYDEETWLVVKIFSNQGDRQRRGYWLAGNDIYHDGNFTWVSGKPFVYSPGHKFNFEGSRPLQPGTPFSKSFNCLFLFQDTEDGSRPWFDIDCFRDIYPICMKLNQ